MCRGLDLFLPSVNIMYNLQYHVKTKSLALFTIQRTYSYFPSYKCACVCVDLCDFKWIGKYHHSEDTDLHHHYRAFLYYPFVATFVKVKSEVAHLCPTLCDPMDCSLPGSSVHGIFQVIVLEWIAISFSGNLPDPGIEPRSPAL